MQVLTNSVDVLSALSRKSNQWGLYLSAGAPDDMTLDTFKSEIEKAILWASKLEDFLYDPFYAVDTFVLFDSEEECREAYDGVVGDDGPTVSNPYNGSVRVYAVMTDANGTVVTENT